MASICYSLDGAAWTQVAYPGGDGYGLTVAGLGAHTLRYYAVDGAGNTQVGYDVSLVTVTSGGATLATAASLPPTHRASRRHWAHRRPRH